MLRKLVTLAGALAAATVLSVQGAAAATISFDDDAVAQTGTLSSAGGAGSTVSGNSILFSSISATGANGAAPLACTGCVLNFTTGAYAGGLSYGGGGTFTLTGAVGGLGLPAGSLLLSGTFSSAAIVTGGTGATFSGFGTDEKNIAILNYFGLAPGTFDFVSTDIVTAAPIVAGTAFNVGVNNADIDNTNRPVVPEPASLLLLGTGLVGVGRSVRRRMRKA
jgi:hypothetical protein